MKPRSQLTSGSQLVKGRNEAARKAGEPAAKGTPRLDPAARRAMILEKAITFFADYGLTAQTRALAQAIGVTQRLLYRYFPSKAELLREVYDAAILSPFKALWLVQLTDRNRPMRERLVAFYGDYNANVLTKRWLRLFLYASLGETEMAPEYIQAIVARLLETIASEAAFELGVTLPENRPVVHELAWILHGSISHYAIRRHVYGAGRNVEPDAVVAMNVDMFMAGFAKAAQNFDLPSGVAQKSDATLEIVN